MNYQDALENTLRIGLMQYHFFFHQFLNGMVMILIRVKSLNLLPVF